MTADATLNDFERIPSGTLRALFFVILSGLSATYVALLAAPRLPKLGTAIAGMLAFAVPLVAAFPVGSRDVFAYAFFGKMLMVHGVDPYVTPPSALATDPWFPLLQAWWKDATIVYGPPFAWQTRLYHSLAGGNLTGVVAAHKIGNLALLPFSALLIRAVGRSLDGGGDRAREAADRAAVAWLWNPLVLFESLVSGHNDLVMTSLLLLAVLWTIRDRWLAGATVLAVSVWYKWYTAVLAPFWIVWAFRRWGMKVGARRLALAAACAAALSAILLAPLAGSLGEAARHALEHPVARLLFPTELPPPLWILFQLIERRGGFESTWGRPLFDGIRLLAFATGLAFVVLRRRSAPYDARAFVEDLIWSYLLFAGFLLTILYPWHLLGACALALAVAERSFERIAAGITVVALLSYFLTFAVSFLAVLLCLVSLWLLRRRASPQSS